MDSKVFLTYLPQQAAPATAVQVETGQSGYPAAMARHVELPPSQGPHGGPLPSPHVEQGGVGTSGKKPRRDRTTFTSHQISVMEEVYQKTGYPDVFQREEIALRTELPDPTIGIWFKNRRAKDRNQGKLKSPSKLIQKPSLALNPPGSWCIQQEQGSQKVKVKSDVSSNQVGKSQMQMSYNNPVTMPYPVTTNTSSLYSSQTQSPLLNSNLPTTVSPAFIPSFPSMSSSVSSFMHRGKYHQAGQAHYGNYNQSNQARYSHQGLAKNLPVVTEAFEPILLALLRQAPEVV